MRRSLDRWVAQALADGLDAEAIASSVDDALARTRAEQTG